MGSPRHPQPSLIHLASGVHADIVLLPESTPEGKTLRGDTPPLRAKADTGPFLARFTARRVRKLVCAPKSGIDVARRPHDVVREVRVLERARHVNVVSLLSYAFDAASQTHSLRMPLLALNLDEVFLLLPSPDLETSGDVVGIFAHVAAGALCGLAHLHGLGIAHRDVKPANIMTDFDGGVQLVDFGTAWDGPDTGGDDGRGGMSCAVGTGPYRAPELLFSPPTYDTQALDMWSLGATLAEFFRPREGASRTAASASSDEDDDDDSGETPECFNEDSFSDTSGPSRIANEYPAPRPLFSATFGELGLAASIFRLLGTPTDELWPTFNRLPDAEKMLFDERPARPLRTALLVPAGEAGDAADALLTGMLSLDPAKRRSSVRCLEDMGIEEAVTGGKGALAGMMAVGAVRIKELVGGAGKARIVALEGV